MNGFMMPPEDIIWPIRIFAYALPLRWQIQGSTYILWAMGDHTYGGTERCVFNATGEGECSQGFFCPDAPPTSCYGETGEEILDSFAANYSCFTSENTVALCMLYILLFALVCKLVYALALSAVRGGKMVKPPGTPSPRAALSPSEPPPLPPPSLSTVQLTRLCRHTSSSPGSPSTSGSTVDLLRTQDDTATEEPGPMLAALHNRIVAFGWPPYLLPPDKQLRFQEKVERSQRPSQDDGALSSQITITLSRPRVRGIEIWAVEWATKIHFRLSYDKVTEVQGVSAGAAFLKGVKLNVVSISHSKSGGGLDFFVKPRLLPGFTVTLACEHFEQRAWDRRAQCGVTT